MAKANKQEQDYLTFSILEQQAIGTEIRGVHALTGNEVYALRSEMYDGQLTWNVDGFGTYRTRALTFLGHSWQIVAVGVEEV